MIPRVDFDPRPRPHVSLIVNKRHARMSLSRSRLVAVWLIAIAALASGVAAAADDSNVKKTTVMVPMHDGVQTPAGQKPVATSYPVYACPDSWTDR